MMDLGEAAFDPFVHLFFWQNRNSCFSLAKSEFRPPGSSRWSLFSSPWEIRGLLVFSILRWRNQNSALPLIIQSI